MSDVIEESRSDVRERCGRNLRKRIKEIYERLKNDVMSVHRKERAFRRKKG